MVDREELNSLFNLRAAAMAEVHRVETAEMQNAEDGSDYLYDIAVATIAAAKIAAISDRRLEILCDVFLETAQSKIVVPGED